MKYHLWTIGCQMNKAESNQIAALLEESGYEPSESPTDADLIVLNTCVVRQSAERKVTGTLGYLKGLAKRPDQAIVVTGCFVGPDTVELHRRFPQVAFFYRPGAIDKFEEWLGLRSEAAPRITERAGQEPAAYVPIIQGCNNFCSYCIVPYRRGRERSRPLAGIVTEVEEIVQRGGREVTLVGQNVDSYGQDLPGTPDLASLLETLNDIRGLARIRFLTNHPKDMSDRLIEAMAVLNKVCPQINLPAQSGDNTVLEAMRRGYTIEHYRDLVGRIRARVPGIALSTDLIVGFPGETEAQFRHTLDLVGDIRFDNVFVAMYSPRPGTTAARDLLDDVPQDVKEDRRSQIEELQTRVATELNVRLLDTTVEVLVEGRKKGKWFGRTRSNKLVFFTCSADCLGKLMGITILSTSPFSLQGTPVLPAPA